MLLNSPHPVALAGNRLRLVSFSASRTMTAMKDCNHFSCAQLKAPLPHSPIDEIRIYMYLNLMIDFDSSMPFSAISMLSE
jgi:hypothetical protein